jgi:8-oxo-dGTP diphosphatase
MPVRVAIGIVWDAAGQVLVGTRPAGTVYAGYDEFPGGKAEPGESLPDCAAREVLEETGLAVRVAPAPRLAVTHRYPHGLVAAHFFDCFAAADARPRPPYRFVPVATTVGMTFPEANAPLLAELRARPGPAAPGFPDG